MLRALTGALRALPRALAIYPAPALLDEFPYPPELLSKPSAGRKRTHGTQRIAPSLRSLSSLAATFEIVPPDWPFWDIPRPARPKQPPFVQIHADPAFAKQGWHSFRSGRIMRANFAAIHCFSATNATGIAVADDVACRFCLAGTCRTAAKRLHHKFFLNVSGKL